MLLQEINRIEILERREDPGARNVLDNLYGQRDNNYLSSSDDSDVSMQDYEELEIFNRIHEQEDDLTSGYSTISSSKEEAYMHRLVQSQQVAEAVAKASQLNKLSNTGVLPPTLAEQEQARLTEDGRDSGSKGEIALEDVISSERFKILRTQKNALTIEPSKLEDVEFFRA